ncbi:MAG: TatD family hydrolase [Burkholderiaceae bacterium]|nr:TatD family hydrolase [Burkholderiaceae bacterium]
MLIDTHCHLDAAEFDADREAVLARAFAAGVDAIVVPAVAPSNHDTVRALAGVDRRLAYALGIHPLFVERASADDLVLLRERVADSMADAAFVAIGEIGLDFFMEGQDRERQQHFLAEQLRIAREFELPVLLHVRRAHDLVLAQLRRVRPLTGIAHAFNASVQQATQYLELGFALGFGGAMTFDRALRIRRLASELPSHAHVLETDAPDIAPEWIARERNEPAQVARIADVFAGLRSISREQAIAQTAENALRALPRLARALDSPAGVAAQRAHRLRRSS